MAYLDADVREKLRERLVDLAGPVRLVFFKEGASRSCEQAEGLLREVALLSERLELRVLDRRLDDKAAAGVPGVPALTLEGRAGGRVRLLGRLAGYEFAVFLAALKDAAAGEADVGEEARAILASVARPVVIRVFVSPDCVRCPRAARTAQRFATVHPLVSAEIIDAAEFPALSARCRVEWVPTTVINGRVMLLGAAPEPALARAAALAVQGEGLAPDSQPRAGWVKIPNP